MSYYVMPAVKHRLRGSLAALESMNYALGDYIDAEDFDPSDFLKMVDNMRVEFAFVEQFITQQMLMGEGTADQTEVVDDSDVSVVEE